ncbi:MAG TPA: DALR domain-containing protein, partial [Nitrososphaerales archaeon]|nr:DALR domain-containing protein [Nitrososphaerales archaeon]
DALRSFSAEQLRVFLLGVHYRRDMDLKGLRAAARRYSRLQSSVKRLRQSAGPPAGDEHDQELSNRFERAMNDDINTPLALDVLETGILSALDVRSPAATRRFLSSLDSASKILGVDF